MLRGARLDGQIDVGLLDRQFGERALVDDVDDVAALLGDDGGDPDQTARAVGHADAQPHQPLGAHQPAQDHRRQQPAVDIAATQDEADAAAPEPLRVAGDGGEAGGTSTLGHRLLDLQQLQHRGLDRRLLDQHHIVDQPLDDREGDVARLLDRDALGDGGAAGHGRKPA